MNFSKTELHGARVPKRCATIYIQEKSNATNETRHELVWPLLINQLQKEDFNSSCIHRIDLLTVRASTVTVVITPLIALLGATGVKSLPAVLFNSLNTSGQLQYFVRGIPSSDAAKPTRIH